jgi:hypothetical protein
MSACTSSSKHSAAHTSPGPHNSATTSGFQAGPDPCRLVNPHDIFTALNQHMTKSGGSRSTCSYMNAQTTDTVSITTAKMTTPTGAEQAVASTARTVKVKVQHLRGVGDTAVAYLTTTTTRSVATCLFAKNGTFVFLLVGSPNAGHLMQEAIALAHKAASSI